MSKENTTNKATTTSTKEVVAAKDQEIVNLKATITTKDQEIADLKSALEKATNKVAKEEKPKYKDYQFKVDKFTFKGKKYTAEEAVKEKELMEALIKAKFTGILKVK